MQTTPIATPTSRMMRLTRALLALAALVLVSGVATAGTITVTTTNDELDLDPNATCSLREAVVTINKGIAVGGCSVDGTLGTNDTIVLPAGTYILTRPADPLFNGEGGALRTWRSTRIVGEGAATTIIDGDNRDRVIANVGGVLRLEGLSIVNGRAVFNTGLGRGGGILLQRTGARLVLEDVVLRDNVANVGGGIHNSRGTVTLLRTTIRHNAATTGDGGGISSLGNVTMIDSTVSGNRAFEGRGGGLYIQVDYPTEGVARMITSTISGNAAAGGGGGIWNQGRRIALENVTVTANSGGGVHQVADGDNRIDLYNTILAGNAVGADCSGPIGSGGFNLIGIATGCPLTGVVASDQIGTSSAPIDARLGPLLPNGGANRTHALLDGSPAIDRGAFPFVGGCGNVDQRGAPRPTDGVGNAIVRCDIGAYEAPTVPATADLRVTLTQTPNPVFPLGAMTTTIDIVNHGPARALGASYALALPSGSPLPTELAPGCEPAGPRAYRCSIGHIAIGGTRTITTIVQAPRSLGNATTGVRVESDLDDPLGGNAASATTRVIAPPTDLHVTLFAEEDPVGTDGAFWYTATVHNLNPRVDATAVEVRHVLSSGSLTRCESVSCTIGGNRAIVTLSTVAADTSVTYRLRAAAPASPDTLTHTMTVTSTNNATAIATSDVTVLAAGADLGVELVASAEAVDAGSIIRYSLSATNLGPSRTEAWFTLEIPEGATFGNVSGSRGCAEQDARTIACDFGDPLWPGSGGVLAHIDVTAPMQAGMATATATIAGPLPDAQPNNDSASASVMVAPTPTTRADVMLSLVAPEWVLPGEPLSYGIGVTNLGPDEAELVVVAFELPEGVVVLTSSPDCASPDGTLTCRLSRLPFGDDHGFEVTVIAPDTLGQLTTTARVTTATDDPRVENDAASVATEVVAEEPESGIVVLVEAGPRTLTAVTTESGAAPVPALQASFRTEATPLELVALRLGREASAGSAGGTLRIYRDVDADATVAPDDVLLATHVFGATDVDLVIALDTTLSVAADADGVVLVTFEGAPRSSSTVAPFALVGLLALVGLRVPRRRRLALSLVVALTLTSCARTPTTPVGTSTVRFQLVDAVFDAEDTRLVGAPVLGPTITVRE